MAKHFSRKPKVAAGMLRGAGPREHAHISPAEKADLNRQRGKIYASEGKGSKGNRFCPHVKKADAAGKKGRAPLTN